MEADASRSLQEASDLAKIVMPTPRGMTIWSAVHRALQPSRRELNLAGLGAAVRYVKISRG
ncbi:hypothetical protein [Mesorhizobium sp. M1396]|uniref:hypothetical protein n=1 Tax=Mesorhizobium sp. M1396 TaxID=2957095 RepID=UPI00333BC6B3